MESSAIVIIPSEEAVSPLAAQLAVQLEQAVAGVINPPAGRFIGPDGRIDLLEMAMLETCAVVELPVVHRFTPGLYVREIFMPAGTLIATKTDKTEHPYVVTKGRVTVFTDAVGIELIEAPHVGITKPGTRRVLFIHEDTIWLTFHANPDDGTDLAAIEQRLIERRELVNGKSAFDFYQEVLQLLKRSDGGRAAGRV
jgi:hypothetical protein